MSFTVWNNCTLATMDSSLSQAYGLITDAAIVASNGSIVWLGAQQDLPEQWRDLNNNSESNTAIDCAGRLITPGLIDCHTHLVYAGDRAAEFEARLNGASYEEISKAGGGINSTVRATREATPETLKAQSAVRLKALLAEGVTTIEIKSGYGLALEHEQKSLVAARELGREFPVDVMTTFLGAHAIPPEYAGRADEYVTAVIDMLIELNKNGLVDSVDAFCERIGFTSAQVRRVFENAKALGLPVKLHAEQLSDSAGTELACEFNALSCDHLEWLSDAGISAMKKSGTVAVLLPAAFYYLRETKLPPIEALRAAQVPIALSTDCNPGSSPCTSILLVLNMASTLFRLTPEEAVVGVTRNAAMALGLSDRGVLAIGKKADFAIWNVKQPAQLVYALGANPLHSVIKNGVLVRQASDHV
jgi:imidazolonepropionase